VSEDEPRSSLIPPPPEHRWRVPLRPPPDAASMVIPWWIPPMFVLFALILAPWIVWLFFTLPSNTVANHWEIAWGGFDIALGGLLVSTGIALARRSAEAGRLAGTTAGLLFADAWFDTTTSHGRGTLAIALLEAFLVELPLAFLCLWIAHNIERILDDVRPFLVRAGFRIEHRRLVPPEGYRSDVDV
jgi:hypothetical protein